MKRVKHYTWAKARKEIGDSENYKLAREVSIKKWQEILKYETRYYKKTEDCGFCFVMSNRGDFCEFDCPARRICGIVSMKIKTRKMTKTEIRRVLKGLKSLKIK